MTNSSETAIYKLDQPDSEMEPSGTVADVGTIEGNAPAPPFRWEDWYATVGGRTIDIAEVNTYIRQIHTEQYPRFDGPVAASRHAFDTAEAAATHIKERATECGADLVGICEIEPSDIYKGRTVTEKYAIALGMRMRWREFQVVPSQASAIECLRVYHALGETVIQLAEHIRSLGYACRVEHPIGDSDLLHIPIALKAGFGELGRHGSVINPRLGPLFRMGSVITSLPLAIDHPIDAGIAAFCDKCRLCRRHCPADAIPDERDPTSAPDHLGNHRYRVDTGRCFPYFAKHYYCSICLPVCIYNHKEWARDFDGHETKLFPQVVMQAPPPPTDLPEPRSHSYPHLKRS